MCMSTRIPPSLKWLIDKRARVSGEIEKTKKSLKTAHQLIDELKELEDTLSAIDKTFELHEIQIDKSLIRPINSKYLRLKIPYGGINNAIITCLKLYKSDFPVPKADILNFVIAKYYDYEVDAVPGKQIARCVHNGLNRLYHAGTIVRCHNPKSNDEGLWKLSKPFIDPLQD